MKLLENIDDELMLNRSNFVANLMSKFLSKINKYGKILILNLELQHTVVNKLLLFNVIGSVYFENAMDCRRRSNESLVNPSHN